MRRYPLLLVSLLMAVTGVVVVPALTVPASADTVRFVDTRGDVRTYIGLEGVAYEPQVVDRPSLDLTGFRATYDPTRIRAVLRYQDLRLVNGSFWATLYLYHRAPGAEDYDRGAVEVFIARSRPRGFHYTYFEDFGRTCRANHKVDLERDEIVVSIPSTCVNNLDEVLVSVDSWYSSRTDSGRFFFDVAPNEGQSALPLSRTAA